MGLSPGTRFGAYEILSLAGAGGMVEVYKARDTRLDRTVAIKILPPILAADPRFRERFDREARVVSQLDHPNVCHPGSSSSEWLLDCSPGCTLLPRDPVRRPPR